MPKIYQLGKKRKPSKNLIDTLNGMSKDDLKKEVIQLLNQTQSKSQEIQKLKNINLKQKKKIKNYQLAQKKSKIKNSLHETHEEILELYEDEQIKKKIQEIKLFHINGKIKCKIPTLLALD